MSRAPRWWRPAPRRNVRPAVRATRRRQASPDSFTAGYDVGRQEEAERSRQRDEQLRRLDEAADAAEHGDMSLLDAFIGDGQAAADDLLEVADAAGVTPPQVDGEQLVDELEAWLRGQDGDG